MQSTSSTAEYPHVKMPGEKADTSYASEVVPDGAAARSKKQKIKNVQSDKIYKETEDEEGLESTFSENTTAFSNENGKRKK